MSATAQITVAFVNPPKTGKKRWTIKDKSEVLWGAMPDIAAKFKQGGVYNITYREEAFNGNIYKVVESVLEVSAPPANQPAAPGGSTYKPYDADTQRRIFVCGAMNAILSNTNTIPSNIPSESLVMIINTLCTAYNNSMLSKGQKFDEEMGDEIPF
jgi:hypothetical protein